MHLECELGLVRGTFDLKAKLDVTFQHALGIYGHTGSGKTTLLKCLAGLVSPESGRVVLGGDVWHDEVEKVPTRARRIGWVGQQPALFPHLSVDGNVNYGWKRRTPRAGEMTPGSIIDQLGIGHLSKRSVSDLSGGERQKVAIARAVASSPQFLFMDEPLSAMDDDSRRDVLAFLRRLATDERIAIIYVSHRKSELRQLVDTTVMMENGRVSSLGNVSLIDRVESRQSHLMLEMEVIEKRSDGTVLLELASEPSLKLVAEAGSELGHSVKVNLRCDTAVLSFGRIEGSSFCCSWAAEVVSVVINDAGFLVGLRMAGQTFEIQLSRLATAELRLAEGSAVFVSFQDLIIRH